MKTLKTTLGTLSLVALSVSTALAASFPGGQPITATELTMDNPPLPAAPPAYSYNPASQTSNISHEEYARFAWRQFIHFNSPTRKNGTNTAGKSPINRGVQDSSRGFVDSGDTHFYSNGKNMSNNFSSNILLWESFAHRVELFPNNGVAQTSGIENLTPNYKFTNKAANNTTLTVDPTQARFNNLDENSQIGLDYIYFPKNGSKPNDNPINDDIILFQAKVNDVEYTHVANNSGSTAPPSFELPPMSGNPGESVEIKAAWRYAGTSSGIDTSRYHIAEANYYTEDSSGVAKVHTATFALVGLHIIRKMENYDTFVYSTFEHVDNLRKNGGTGADTGVYFYTTYDELSYNAPPATPVTPDQSAHSNGYQPNAIVNNGATRSSVLLPKQGAVTKSNNYPFISGGPYTIPVNGAGPIKVAEDGSKTLAVSNVNREVHTTMHNSGQFNNSVWQYYTLKGIQPVPTDEDTSIAGKDNPLTQDFYLANNVIESSRPGVQLFKGGFNLTGNTFYNHREQGNIFNIPDHTGKNMGGCMGCHGNATYMNKTNNAGKGTKTSIFSFLINEARLGGGNRFEADVINETNIQDVTSASARPYLKSSK